VQPTDYSANNNLDTILDKVNHLLTIFNDWESRLTEWVGAEVNSRLDIETQHWKFAVEKLEDRIDKYEMKILFSAHIRNFNT